MKLLLPAALCAAALVFAPAAQATVFYTLSGSFTADLDPDPDVENNETFDWTFQFETADYVMSLQNVTPSSCTITGTFYACAATQLIDPTSSTFGGSIDDAFVSFQVENTDGSGGGGAFYFFAGGAFGADGVYTNAGQPDPNGPTSDGGFVGNAGPATLIVASQVTTAVPEPATWAMMIAGFGLTGAALRRRLPRAAAA